MLQPISPSNPLAKIFNKIQYILSGNKSLVNFDSLLQYLNYGCYEEIKNEEQ